MPTSSRTALGRLLPSDARDYHHTEYANGFHVFNVRPILPPANERLAFCNLHLQPRQDCVRWRDLSAGVTVQQSVDTFVGPGGTSARQVQANAPFWQSENALNFPLARRHSGIAPKIKLTASRELFLRGLPSHERCSSCRKGRNVATEQFVASIVQQALETSGFFSEPIFANLAE
jgi:hypothetical protein